MQKQNKVIFIDIDGVLNSDELNEMSPEMNLGICSDRCKVLKRLVDQTKASLVLCGPWRLHKGKDYEYLINKLSNVGLKFSDELPDDGNDLQRAKQIKDYLSKHKSITSYVILDDMFYNQFEAAGIGDRFVQINNDVGLNADNLQKATYILNNFETKFEEYAAVFSDNKKGLL